MLYAMTQEQLAHTVFPLGDMRKSEVRALAEKSGFLNADKPDSQDICFVPDGDYAGVIERQSGTPSVPGNFVDTQGRVLGRHKGVIHYTVCQRKGIGLSGETPLYVCRICPQSGDIVLGHGEDLYSREAEASDFNWISGTVPDSAFRCQVKIRYRQPSQGATVIPTGEDTVRILFDEPQRAVTPGQAAVLYDGDTVLGGGSIQ